MIIIKTPLRVSLLGGGSDHYNFFKNNYASVISSSINKYIYLSLNEKFLDGLKLSYSQIENVNKINDINHNIIRETLKYYNFQKTNIEITSISDIHSNGTGLGSSSAFTISLIHALRKYLKKKINSEILAKESSNIEINILKSPIGYQDQYQCAFGGLNRIEFNSKKINVIRLKNSKKKLNFLNNHISCIYTDIERKTNTILEKQNKDLDKNIKKIRNLKEIVSMIPDFIKSIEHENIKEVGNILNKSWELKKTLEKNISSKKINDLYSYTISKGALGGKILGAGGGGFLLLIVNNKKNFETKNQNLNFLNFKFVNEKSNLIYE